MTQPLCRLCPNPAFFNFRQGVLLCAECAAEIFKMCEIDSTCGVVEGHDETKTGEWQDRRPALIHPEAGIKPGPQDNSSPSVSASPEVNEGAEFEDGIPEFLRRVG